MSASAIDPLQIKEGLSASDLMIPTDEAVMLRLFAPRGFQIEYGTCDGFLPGPAMTWPEVLQHLRGHRRAPNPCAVRVRVAQ